MPSLEEFAINESGAGSFPVACRTLARTFLAAWLTAIAAVVVLPAILVFGIAAAIVRRMTPRKKAQVTVIDGKYHVLSEAIKTS